jgi:hypothetical protein
MRYVKGSELSAELQRECLAKFVHRYTVDHKPEWAKQPMGNGKLPPVQFISDREWLEHTLFPITNAGKLALRHSCNSNPTFPTSEQIEHAKREQQQHAKQEAERKALERALVIANEYGLERAQSFLLSNGVDTFGIEHVSCGDHELAYINRGDTYARTVCKEIGEGNKAFLSSWGDWLEEAEQEHATETETQRCGYCGESTPDDCPVCQHCGKQVDGGNAPRFNWGQFVGTVSHATMRTEDLIPAFIDKLEEIAAEFNRVGDRVICHSILEQIADIKQRTESDDAEDYYDSEEASIDLNETLFELLNQHSPPYFYFGSHPGDGSDYGFWLSEDLQQEITDSDGVCVADLSEVPAGHMGEVLLINDHGNATLYTAEWDSVGKSHTFHEIWAIV